jgi:hypothetical protein
LESFQNFNVGDGSSAPELYTIGPDGFECGFIDPDGFEYGFIDPDGFEYGFIE